MNCVKISQLKYEFKTAVRLVRDEAGLVESIKSWSRLSSYFRYTKTVQKFNL